MQNMNGQNNQPMPAVGWEKIDNTPIPDPSLKYRKELKSTANKAALGMLFFFGFELMYQFFMSILVSVFSLMGESVYNDFADFVTNPNFNLIFNSFYQLFFMTLPFIFSALISRVKLTDMLNYRKPIKGTLFPIAFMGLGGAVLCNLANSIIMTFLSAFGITPSGGNIEMELSFGSFLLNILCVAVVPALFEEFAFRGVMMGILSKKFSVQTSIILSAAAFGLIHGNFVQIPFAFLMGLILGYSYAITKSLWVPMLIHFLNNAYSVVMDHLISGMSATMGNIVFYASFIALLLIGLIGFAMAAKRKPEIFSFPREDQVISNHKMLKIGFSAPIMIVITVLYLLEALEVQLL